MSLTLLVPCLVAASLSVVSVSPELNASNVASSGDIVIEFDSPIGIGALPPASDDVTVFGKSTGPASGTARDS